MNKEDNTKETIKKITIQLVDEKGDPTGSTREAEFVTYRLSQGKKRELKSSANINKFATIDMTDLGPDEEPSMKNFKDLNFVGLQDARADVDEKLTLLIWGVSDLTTDNIPAEQFSQMLHTVTEADLLDFKREQREFEEAKKKKDQEKKDQEAGQQTI